MRCLTDSRGSLFALLLSVATLAPLVGGCGDSGSPPRGSGDGPDGLGPGQSPEPSLTDETPGVAPSGSDNPVGEPNPEPSDNPGPEPGPEPDPPVGGPSNPPPPPAGATECVDPSLIGPTPIRRVSTEEYTNAVRDVLQAVINPGQLPADEKLGIFQVNVATRVTDDHFERYRSLANSVSADVVANFPALSGCSSAAESACVSGFLQSAARRLFHGTLEPADSDRLLDVYTSLTAETDAEVALAAAVQWMLLSPRFLFLVEFGQGADANRAKLSGSEIAGRLAAFFWRTVPDEALLAAADAGSLDTPEGVRAQADLMLSDPRSTAMLESFGQQLLRIVPPGPDADALEQQKKAQVGEIFAKASTDAAMTYADLIVGEHAPSGSELASFYGSEDRRGILLTAGFLASNSTGDFGSPVQRGYMIRAGLLCGVVPPPSDPTDMQLTDNAGGNLQEVFNAHSNVEVCWQCHKLMDPIGDAFGQYDAEGAFDASLVPDTSGTIKPDDPENAGSFQDVDGLLTLLSQEPTATQCFVLQASRYALGRNETVKDACGIEAITQSFEAASFSVRELLLNIAASSTFMDRNPVVAGGQCR